MISFSLWRRRPIAAANGATVCAGMALMGLTTFPAHVCAGRAAPLVCRRGSGADDDGRRLAGWSNHRRQDFPHVRAQAHHAGRQRTDPRGRCFLRQLSMPKVRRWSPASVRSSWGFGMGLLSVSSLVLIQEIVEWSQRGSATASNLFARNLGSTLGATVLGAVLNAGLGLSRKHAAITSDQLRDLLQASEGSVAGDAVVRVALHDALQLTFWAMLAITVLIVVFAVMVPSNPTARPGER